MQNVFRWFRFRWALYVTYRIIQSKTSSEMCFLHLTHPSTHTPGAVGSRHGGAGEQSGVRCLAQGSHLSRGQFLPEPRFEPITSGYKSRHIKDRSFFFSSEFQCKETRHSLSPNVSAHPPVAYTFLSIFLFLFSNKETFFKYLINFYFKFCPNFVFLVKNYSYVNLNSFSIHSTSLH